MSFRNAQEYLMKSGNYLHCPNFTHLICSLFSVLLLPSICIYFTPPLLLSFQGLSTPTFLLPTLLPYSLSFLLYIRVPTIFIFPPLDHTAIYLPDPSITLPNIY